MQLEREVSELESLIESKIYHQDDLETRIQELERDLRVSHSSTAPPLPRHPQILASQGASTSGSGGTAPLRTPTRSSSLAASHASVSGSKGSGRPSPDSTTGSSKTGSIHTAEEYPSPPRRDDEEGEVRCELCEGPHELDSCPVFAGNLDALPTPTIGSGGGRVPGMRCADCDVSCLVFLYWTQAR